MRRGRGLPGHLPRLRGMAVTPLRLLTWRPACPLLKASSASRQRPYGLSRLAGRIASRLTFSTYRRGYGARAWRRKAMPRSMRRPPSPVSSPRTNGARCWQAGYQAARGDGSRHDIASRFDTVVLQTVPDPLPASGVHPLSFLNDLIRPSIPSNPRSIGPSCRFAAARTTPSIGVPLQRLRAFGGEGVLAVFFGVQSRGKDPRRS